MSSRLPSNVVRPSWNDVFMAIAHTLSKRGTCPRLQVGSVLIDKQHHIIATGYNGAPRSSTHCSDGGCDLVGDRCVRTVHAEVNALIQAGRHAENSTLYSTYFPCDRCWPIIANAQVKKVFYKEGFGNYFNTHEQACEAMLIKYGIVTERL